MLDTIKLLNNFNEAARNFSHEEINNLGKYILELGTKEYPVSVLASVETHVNNNKKLCHDFQVIYESMGDEDKSVMRKLAPRITKQESVEKILGESYKTFNKKEDNIEHVRLGKPNELLLKCKNTFNPRLYQQKLGSLSKFRALKICSQEYAGDGKKLIGVRLMNELCPVIIYTQLIDENQPEEFGKYLEFIPLPSLLHNGTHYSELVSYMHKKEYLEALHEYHRHIFGKRSVNKINNINIHPQTKDSRCKSLNSDWCAWLEGAQGIRTNNNDTDTSREISLNLEEYTYPTFSVLLKGCAETKIENGNFTRDILISDSTTYTPLFRYCIVANEAIDGYGNQRENQYPNCVSGSGIHFSAYDNMPISIHTNMLKPISQGESDDSEEHDIQVVLDIKEADINNIKFFLFTLMNQKGISLKKLILCGGEVESPELAEKIARDFSITEVNFCCYSELRGNINPNLIVLFSSQNIILEKQETIKKLISQFKSDRVGSVSCKITYVDIESEKIKEKKSSSGQLMKKKNYSTNTDIVEIETQNSFNQIHGTHFNVIANNYDFTLINGRDIIYSDLELNNIQEFICGLTLNFAIESRINTVDTTIKVYCTGLETLNSKNWMNKEKAKVLTDNWDIYRNRISHEIQLLS